MASSSDAGEKKGTWKLTDSIRSQLEGYSLKCLQNYINTYGHKFTVEAQEEIGEIRFRKELAAEDSDAKPAPGQQPQRAKSTSSRAHSTSRKDDGGHAKATPAVSKQRSKTVERAAEARSGGSGSQKAKTVSRAAEARSGGSGSQKNKSSGREQQHQKADSGQKKKPPAVRDETEAEVAKREARGDALMKKYGPMKWSGARDRRRLPKNLDITEISQYMNVLADYHIKPAPKAAGFFVCQARSCNHKHLLSQVAAAEHVATHHAHTETVKDTRLDRRRDWNAIIFISDYTHEDFTEFKCAYCEKDVFARGRVFASHRELLDHLMDKHSRSYAVEALTDPAAWDGLPRGLLYPPVDKNDPVVRRGYNGLTDYGISSGRTWGWHDLAIDDPAQEFGCKSRECNPQAAYDAQEMVMHERNYHDRYRLRAFTHQAALTQAVNELYANRRARLINKELDRREEANEKRMKTLEAEMEEDGLDERQRVERREEERAKIKRHDTVLFPVDVVIAPFSCYFSQCKEKKPAVVIECLLDQTVHLLQFHPCRAAEVIEKLKRKPTPFLEADVSDSESEVEEEPKARPAEQQAVEEEEGAEQQAVDEEEGAEEGAEPPEKKVKRAPKAGRASQRAGSSAASSGGSPSKPGRKPLSEAVCTFEGGKWKASCCGKLCTRRYDCKRHMTICTKGQAKLEELHVGLPVSLRSPRTVSRSPTSKHRKSASLKVRTLHRKRDRGDVSTSESESGRSFSGGSSRSSSSDGGARKEHKHRASSSGARHGTPLSGKRHGDGSGSSGPPAKQAKKTESTRDEGVKRNRFADTVYGSSGDEVAARSELDNSDSDSELLVKRAAAASSSKAKHRSKTGDASANISPMSAKSGTSASGSTPSASPASIPLASGGTPSASPATIPIAKGTTSPPASIPIASGTTPAPTPATIPIASGTASTTPAKIPAETGNVFDRVTCTGTPPAGKSSGDLMSSLFGLQRKAPPAKQDDNEKKGNNEKKGSNEPTDGAGAAAHVEGEGGEPGVVAASPKATSGASSTAASPSSSTAETTEAADDGDLLSPAPFEFNLASSEEDEPSARGSQALDQTPNPKTGVTQVFPSDDSQSQSAGQSARQSDALKPTPTTDEQSADADHHDIQERTDDKDKPETTDKDKETPAKEAVAGGHVVVPVGGTIALNISRRRHSSATTLLELLERDDKRDTAPLRSRFASEGAKKKCTLTFRVTEQDVVRTLGDFLAQAKREGQRLPTWVGMRDAKKPTKRPFTANLEHIVDLLRQNEAQQRVAEPWRYVRTVGAPSRAFLPERVAAPIDRASVPSWQLEEDKQRRVAFYMVVEHRLKLLKQEAAQKAAEREEAERQRESASAATLENSGGDMPLDADALFSGVAKATEPTAGDLLKEGDGDKLAEKAESGGVNKEQEKAVAAPVAPDDKKPDGGESTDEDDDDSAEFEDSEEEEEDDEAPAKPGELAELRAYKRTNKKRAKYILHCLDKLGDTIRATKKQKLIDAMEDADAEAELISKGK